MSDTELLRLLEARAQGTNDEIQKRRKRHAALFEEVYKLEAEMAALGIVLGSVLAAERDIRSGGSRADAKEPDARTVAERSEKDGATWQSCTKEET